MDQLTPVPVHRGREQASRVRRLSPWSLVVSDDLGGYTLARRAFKSALVEIKPFRLKSSEPHAPVALGACWPVDVLQTEKKSKLLHKGAPVRLVHRHGVLWRVQKWVEVSEMPNDCQGYLINSTYMFAASEQNVEADYEGQGGQYALYHARHYRTG
jgi:hypothetical protein